MPDGNLTSLSYERARRGMVPTLRVIEQSPAGRHVFGDPAPRFRPADPGAVYLRTVRLGPDAVEALLDLFQRDAGRTGDWTLHDALQAARDGITEPPPEAA